jgi:hypothetical protein
MRWNKLEWTVGMAMLGLTACGGGGGKGSADAGAADLPRGAAADGKIGNSDPDSKIADLNDAEWKAACIDMSNDLQDRDLSHGLAVLVGLEAKLIGLDCKSMMQMFLETPPDQTQCDSKPADCSATLRELDDCNVSELAWFSDQTKGLDCSSSTSAFGKIDQSYLTSQCKLVKSKCPSFKNLTDQSSSDRGFDTGFDSDAGF